MTWYRNVYRACARKKLFQPSAAIDTQLQRCLSTLDLTFIGVGSTLGAGIYVLAGEVARNKAGPAIIFSFLIAAIASILSGLCYAEFGARVPKAGSAYYYCYITIGELLGFFIGWNLILEYIIGASSIVRSLSAYIDSMAHGAIKNGTLDLIGEFHSPILASYFDLFSILIAVLSTILLSLGVKNSARFNNFCVGVNIITILLVIVVGLVYADVKNWSNFAPFGVSGVFAGAATCFFAFIGFDVIATTSEEAKNPARSIPISITGTIVICFLAYFGVSGVITLMIPYSELDQTAAVTMAFYQRGLKFMGTIVGIGACLGLTGCTIISMMPLPRLLYALSQDGLLPEFLAKVNPNTNIPVISTVISGFMVGLLAAIFDINALVEMLSIGTLLAYTVVDICILILRYKHFEELGDDHDDNSHSSSSSCDSNVTLYMLVVAALVELFIINFMLTKYVHQLADSNLLIVAFVLVVVILSITCYLLARRRPNKFNYSFQVPMLPWIPLLGLFFNTYLMLSLSRFTWYRLFAWLLIGTVVYFTYSMNHSVEKHRTDDGTTMDESRPLINEEETVFLGNAGDSDVVDLKED